MPESALTAALALPSGAATALILQLGAQKLPVARLDTADAPAKLGFVADPQPLPGEKASH